ncbi:hypothetical protein C0Q70_06381 [Pomacea canaliculata]|uniref:Uncharacterized protein n=1 Tax=Pomacea canaliculata TaxID=400727 RepID=A0A2T7PNX3_POMCA|nr:hypothetical protein C0Q70_06381 [Pomacea canaliculata]
MLKLLCGAKPKVIKEVLKGASPDLIKAISECSLNVLKGHVHLTPAQKKRLCKYKEDLRLLARRNTSVKRRKQILQKGGFLSFLLKPILGALGGLVGSFTSNE